MMEQTFEQSIDTMMKSNPSQYMLTLKYHPRIIRKALERIYRRKIIDPENITNVTILQEFEIMKKEESFSDDDLKMKNPNNVLNEGMPKGMDELRQKIMAMRRKMQCECGDQVAYANRGCHHLMCSTCAASPDCNRCGSNITEVDPVEFVRSSNS
ncbi:uncharacterized protein LOC144627128 [Crassostrea virginica]